MTILAFVDIWDVLSFCSFLGVWESRILNIGKKEYCRGWNGGMARIHACKCNIFLNSLKLIKQN
jgi:hypothetical protein